MARSCDSAGCLEDGAEAYIGRLTSTGTVGTIAVRRRAGREGLSMSQELIQQAHFEEQPAGTVIPVDPNVVDAAIDAMKGKS